MRFSRFKFQFWFTYLEGACAFLTLRLIPDPIIEVVEPEIIPAPVILSSIVYGISLSPDRICGILWPCLGLDKGLDSHPCPPTDRNTEQTYIVFLFLDKVFFFGRQGIIFFRTRLIFFLDKVYFSLDKVNIFLYQVIFLIDKVEFFLRQGFIFFRQGYYISGPDYIFVWTRHYFM